ncbi:SGNH/GDSL hydrolase family protein [Rhodococcus sp. X156]|uniref:SGNH/GDSL hydrolase family protein n=1 Tax=Rhodococcus sp. X156 TaxID=2499145 RepID=UPI000FD99CA4|nr:SGNH/GDSL hydrolase family protein [Rhodococcus sp. X156]
MLSIDDLATYWGRRAEQPGDIHYLALGDSLTQGYGAGSPAQSFVSTLAGLLTDATGASVAVTNLAVCGARLEDLVIDQLPALARLRPDVVTVCIGTNDATHTDPDRFRDVFTRLCDTLPNGTFVADVPDFQGGHGDDEARELSAIIREVVAARPALVPVAVQAATAGMTVTEFGTGFAHPDDVGYQRYTRAFWEAMEPALLR